MSNSEHLDIYNIGVYLKSGTQVAHFERDLIHGARTKGDYKDLGSGRKYVEVGFPYDRPYDLTIRTLADLVNKIKCVERTEFLYSKKRLI